LNTFPCEDPLAHNIIRFGRPLWGSLWVANAHSKNHDNFRNIVDLAKFKLLGGVATWHKLEQGEKRAAAIAVIASTAVLYVSPVSSVAVELVKTHMATLIAIDESRKFHIITYPSEPLLSEAALELMSVESAWLEMLQELDLAFRSGGILDAGSQGELAVRLMLLDAWRRLICLKRKREPGVCN
jgi:hypothetical protein